MVANQTLPGLAIMNVLYFLLCSWFTVLFASTPVKFCWGGVRDNHLGFRNVSCTTGQSSLGDMISTKLQPSASDSVSESPQRSSTDTNFRCVIFAYNETSTLENGDVLKFAKANYTCDTEELCLGRESSNPYKYTMHGYEGLLYCCDTENNCNNLDALMNHPEHQHTCFHGDTDNMHQDFQIMVCPHQENQCVRITTKQFRDGQSEVHMVRQQFHCDTTDTCQNHHQEKTCKVSEVHLNATTKQEVETCCCKKDECFHPDWRPAVVNVQQKQEQSALQRTLLIVIGVALGILVVGVAVFFIIRSRRARNQESKPSMPHYSATVFRAISSKEDGINEEDRVQILPATS